MAQINGYTEQTYTPEKKLVNGNFPLLSRNILLLDSAGDGKTFAKGTVLGKIDRVLAATPIVKNLTTGVATVENAIMRRDSKVGDYIVNCYQVVSTKAFLSVTDPDGVQLEGITTTTSTDITYADNNIQFDINTVTTNFAVNDNFVITIDSDTDENYIEAKKTAVDGSREPRAILISEIIIADNSSSPSTEKAQAFITGQFDKDELELDSSWAVADIIDELNKKSIFLS